MALSQLIYVNPSPINDVYNSKNCLFFYFYSVTCAVLFILFVLAGMACATGRDRVYMFGGVLVKKFYFDTSVKIKLNLVISYYNISSLVLRYLKKDTS